MNNWADPVGPGAGKSGFELWNPRAFPQNAFAPTQRKPRLSCPPPKGKPKSGGCAGRTLAIRHKETPANQRENSHGETMISHEQIAFSMNLKI